VTGLLYVAFYKQHKLLFINMKQLT
jgi:hypothetical protein